MTEFGHHPGEFQRESMCHAIHGVDMLDPWILEQLVDLRGTTPTERASIDTELQVLILLH